MDYNKIGSFIAAERKAKNLTQAKLGELIFVSEKTISKWENGNGVPDTHSLPTLCELFGVSLNELLNGKRMTQEEYKNKAEEELFKLQKEKEESDKLLLKLELGFGILSVISFMVLYYFAIYISETFNITTAPLIMIIVGVIILFVFCFLCLKIEQKAGYYICRKCGHKHVPTYGQVNLAMHIGRTRYMKCPKCKEKSWQKKVIK